MSVVFNVRETRSAWTNKLNQLVGLVTGITWDTLSGKPSTFTPSAHTQAASTISDSTVTGRAVLTAADQAAARAAIGAGTSSFDGTYGSLTGKPSTFPPTIGSGAGDAVAGNDARLTDARTPLAHTQAASTISDSTATGRAVLTAVDGAAARAAIGAGTSSFDGTYASLTGKPTLGTLASQNGTFSGTSSGTNTGDQTSIVGITGTIAQFNTACTDADFATGGGTATGTNTGDNAVNSLYSGLATSKQDALVSGTNIKTINGASVLGSGNLTVTAGDPAYSPGSFTVATETYRLQGNDLKLTGSQRATIQGTGRLRLLN